MILLLNSKMKTKVYLAPSSRSSKKWVVVMPEGCGCGCKKKKTIHFGAKGYSDYTINKSATRRNNYLIRHKHNQDWTRSGISTAGFWARYLLWNKPSVDEAIKDIERNFDIDIIKGSPP